MSLVFLWLAMEAAIAEKQVCLPAPTGKQWVCMPPAEVAAWKAAHPETAQAIQPPPAARNQGATTTNAHQFTTETASRAGTSKSIRVAPIPPAAVTTYRNTQPALTTQGRSLPRRATAQKPVLDQDTAIRLLYKAPVTLPGRGPGPRRAPTTLEELQGKPVPQKRDIANRSHEPSETVLAIARPTEQQKAQAVTKPVYQWQVRLLGSARADKLASLRQALPESLQHCRVYSQPLGELPWQELRCGQFRTRAEAQQWATQNRAVFPDGSLPTVVRILP